MQSDEPQTIQQQGRAFKKPRKKSSRPAESRKGPLNITAEEEGKFWSKVNKNGPIVAPGLGACWLWTGAPTGKGKRLYGMFAVRPRLQVFAHRAAYQISRRKELGDLFACHHCDNGMCVRPSHLFAGTNADNQRDMRRKGRDFHVGELPHFSIAHPEKVLKGSTHPRARLTNEDVLEIRATYVNASSELLLAKKFGVKPHQIYVVATRRSWKHLP